MRIAADVEGSKGRSLGPPPYTIAGTYKCMELVTDLSSNGLTAYLADRIDDLSVPIWLLFDIDNDLVPLCIRFLQRDRHALREGAWLETEGTQRCQKD